MKVTLSIAVTQFYDICIIGAGPAGIILALECARLRSGLKIILLEAGPAAAQALDDSVEVEDGRNHHQPPDCSNKGLGGSSQTWGGRCVMYDEVDFLPHGPVAEHCSWGLDFLEATRPYLNLASKYFHCGSDCFTLTEGEPIAERFSCGQVRDDVLEKWSLPTRFGKFYRPQLEATETIDLVIGTVVKEVLPLEQNAGCAVQAVDMASGLVYEIRSARVVLCAGGHETTRLLLKSPLLFAQSNPHVGKYYQGHVSGKIANVRFYGDPNLTRFGFEYEGDVYCRRRFQFTKDALVQHGLLNTAFWLDTPPFYNANHGNGVLSLIYLLMVTPGLRHRLMPAAIAKTIRAKGGQPLWPHLWNVFRGLPSSIVTPAIIFWKRYIQTRSLPGVYLKSKDNRYALHFHAEQVPRVENSMELDETGDNLRIRYSYSFEDVDSVIRSHALLDAELRRMGCGELEYLCPTAELPSRVRCISMDGLHQVGTARISRTPAEGVVDYDLKLWDSPSVYVCSSSVFPTSGQANPTFFLGACAVRLAAHLAATTHQ